MLTRIGMRGLRKNLDFWLSCKESRTDTSKVTSKREVFNLVISWGLSFLIED